MKNNIKIISVTVAAIIALAAAFTGCDSEQRHSASEAASQGASATTSLAETEQTTREMLTGRKAAFKAVIDNTLKECKEKYPYETNYGRYGFYDFDNDGDYELLLEIYGSASADQCVRIYDFDGEKVVFLGEVQSAHSCVHGTDINNAFLLETCWMGASVWRIYEFKNGELVSAELASYYPDGLGEESEPEKNPLPGMGYEIKNIEYYRLDDPTGIKKLRE